MATNLTAKEREVIRRIAHSDYHDRLEDPVWSWDPCGDRSSAAVLGSLIRKGHAGQQGTGRDATCWLTGAGCLEFLEMEPESELSADYHGRHPDALGA